MSKIAGNAPKCEHCGSSYSKVIDKRARDYDRAGDIYRRRECVECGGRFSTWEIGKSDYDYIRTERTARSRGLLIWRRIKAKLGIDRFENMSIIEPSEEAHALWNDETFVKGIEYGVLIGLMKAFSFRREEVK